MLLVKKNKFVIFKNVETKEREVRFVNSVKRTRSVTEAKNAGHKVDDRLNVRCY